MIFVVDLSVQMYGWIDFMYTDNLICKYAITIKFNHRYECFNSFQGIVTTVMWDLRLQDVL